MRREGTSGTEESAGRGGGRSPTEVSTGTTEPGSLTHKKVTYVGLFT